MAARMTPEQLANRRKAARVHVTDGGLTMEQEAYARARALGMSPEEAITAAGGNTPLSTARSWERKNRALAKRIVELSAMATNNAVLKTGLDREWVISRLMSVAERCMQAEPVVDKDGAPTGEYEFDSTGATRALELLGKTMRLFDGKQESEQDAYANLSDDDLVRIAAELAQQSGLTLEHNP